jgi:dTDP-4-amino-4,6-dideoxygalactose transaminase
MMKIPFHKPYWSGREITNLKNVLAQSDGSGDGAYTKEVTDLLRGHFKTERLLMTASASVALEMAVRLAGLEPGDQVIMPSFNFPSAANAVLLAGGIPVFVETGMDLMMDPAAAARAISDRTRGLLVVHYGGAAADMDDLVRLAEKEGLWILEDAAQAFGACGADGRPLGTLGDFGVVSFHGTKVASAGEGGALIINRDDPALWEAANRMHQKGTDRNAFFMGKVDRYSWQGIGMSACPSELQMALLADQLRILPEIIEIQQGIWQRLTKALAPFAGKTFALSPKESQNGHIFWMRFFDKAIALAFQAWMGQRGIAVYTHFVPLHATDFGKAFRGTSQPGLDAETDYQTLIMRLPIFASLTEGQVAYMINCAREFFKEQEE